MSPWIGYCQEGLKVKETDVEYHSVREKPIKIYGLCNPRKHYRRLEKEFAETVSGGVLSHSANSSGGRVRFATDSRYLAIRIKHKNYDGGSPHLSRLNLLGVDLYIKNGEEEQYYTTFLPPVDCEDGYEGIRNFKDRRLREITLCLPIGIEVYEMEIGIEKGAELKEHTPYKIERPIVFYGSSITNGYAASRPGNIYEGFISRALDCNFLDLGFSGSALGEPALAEYIADLDMTAFVLDYDHNAPDTEHLKRTHEPFFKAVRKKNPTLPIVIVSRPSVDLNDDECARRDVILNTYLNAKKAGDRNVCFVDGYTFFPQECKNDCTVDGCHPNDLGMYFMAVRIRRALSDILGI